MLKIYDWKCSSCESVRENMIDVPRGKKPQKSIIRVCADCRKKTRLYRLMSAPAKYLGERTENPRVFGGKNDTMGFKKGPRLPEIKDGENLHDYTKANKELIRQHREIGKQNKAKRARADSIARGNHVNILRDKLPGDPKL